MVSISPPNFLLLSIKVELSGYTLCPHQVDAQWRQFAQETHIPMASRAWRWEYETLVLAKDSNAERLPSFAIKVWLKTKRFLLYFAVSLGWKTFCLMFESGCCRCHSLPTLVFEWQGRENLMCVITAERAKNVTKNTVLELLGNKRYTVFWYFACFEPISPFG